MRFNLDAVFLPAVSRLVATSKGPEKLFLNKLYARDVSLWIEPDEDEDFDDSEAFDNIVLGQFSDDEDSENNE